jgi:hypothetical protein
MALFELLFFAVGIALSILFGKFSYGKIGWWGIPPAPILGFGSVWGADTSPELDFPAACIQRPETSNARLRYKRVRC